MYPNQPFPEQTLVEALHKLPKAAIPQADAQFHKHSIERYTGGIAIYPEQPFPMHRLNSTSPRTSTQVAAQFSQTSHSPSRRSIPQARVRATHAWYQCISAGHKSILNRQYQLHAT